MWIYDQVWADTLLSKGHILLSVRHADSAFLTVARSELVSDLWNSDRPQLDFGETIALLIRSENDRVDHAALRVLDLCGAVLARLQQISSGH